MTIINTASLFIWKTDIRTNGAIFCQISIITHIFHSINIIICGNQKWKGAIPDFKANTIKMIDLEFSWVKLEYFKKSKIEIVIRMIEAIAWGIKYLIADSVELNLNLKRIRGITLIKLISSPSQVTSHDLEEHATTVPMIRNATKII